MLLFLLHNISLILEIVVRRFVHGIITKYKERIFFPTSLLVKKFVQKICYIHVLQSLFFQLVWGQDLQAVRSIKEYHNLVEGI